nr:helix-turn-helix domain-containing protein [Paenibacillus sp. MSJ-34]
MKKARVEKGMTLDDVQELTKIRKRYLEAIEDGDYKVLPGPFYVRAFVKTYAETVGLNADELLELYRGDMPESQTDTIEPIIQSRRRTRSTGRTGKWVSSILMWSFLILIVIVVYLFYIKGAEPKDDQVADGTKITDDMQQPQPPSEGGTTPDEEATPPADETEVTPPEPAPPEIVSKGRSGKAYWYAVKTPEPSVKVEISASGGDSWITVYKKKYDGEKLYNETLKDGVTETFDLVDGLYISVTRPDFAEVKVGGIPLEDGDSAVRRRFLLHLESTADSAAE